MRNKLFSSTVLILSLLINWCSCAISSRLEIRQNSAHKIDLRRSKKPSGPNDFIGHSLIDPVTKSIFIDPLLADSGESFEREPFGRNTNLKLRENPILKKIIDNYDPEQGWNFLEEKKIALVNMAINSYKKTPGNLRIKYFLIAIVKQLEIPANLYFLEFMDVRGFYDEIIRLHITDKS